MLTPRKQYLCGLIRWFEIGFDPRETSGLRASAGCPQFDFYGRIETAFRGSSVPIVDSTCWTFSVSLIERANYLNCSAFELFDWVAASAVAPSLQEAWFPIELCHRRGEGENWKFPALTKRRRCSTLERRFFFDSQTPLAAAPNLRLLSHREMEVCRFLCRSPSTKQCIVNDRISRVGLGESLQSQKHGTVVDWRPATRRIL